MKKLTLTLCAVVAVVSASFAGTSSYSGKEMKQVETPCPQWYADNEWNIGVSFAYAANVSNDDNNNFFFNDTWDDAFGGSLDVKYFFHRYWGIGFQGSIFGTDDNNNNAVFNNDDNNWVGTALATFTFRYAPPCSRFAPYLWVGIGGYFDNNDDNNAVARFNDDNHDGFMGQFGAGFEVRITPHIGWTNDVSFNDVEGGDHDFVMVRTGLNFAF
jgi:hypothetical protein